MSHSEQAWELRYHTLSFVFSLIRKKRCKRITGIDCRRGGREGVGRWLLGSVRAVGGVFPRALSHRDAGLVFARSLSGFDRSRCPSRGRRWLGGRGLPRTLVYGYWRSTS